MYLPSSPFPQTTQTRGGGTLRKQDENKTKKKERKKKRTLEGDPSHRKTEGKIFQTKSDPDGGEGSGERRKGRTEEGEDGGRGSPPRAKKKL